MKYIFLHGPGIDEPVGIIGENRKNYYVGDHLGSIRKIFKDNGKISAEFFYSAFGQRKVLKNLKEFLGRIYSFTGREYDEEIGFFYYRNRYYSGLKRRFITRDPVKFEGGLNFYGYISNEPINKRDPFGTGPYSIAGCIIFGAIDAVMTASTVKKLANELERIKNEIRRLEKESDACKPLSGRYFEVQSEIDELKIDATKVAGDKAKAYLKGSFLALPITVVCKLATKLPW